MKKIRPGVISRMPVPSKKKKADGKNSKDKESDVEEESDEGDDEGDDDEEEDVDEKEEEKSKPSKKKSKKKNEDEEENIETKAEPEPAPASEPNILDLDLLGGPMIPTSGNDKNQSSDVVDLLGDLGGVFANSGPSVQPTQPSQFDSPLGDLFGTPEPQQKIQPQDDTIRYPPKVVFNGKGLCVTFTSSKKPTTPGTLSIEASFTNSSSYDMKNWEFQVAVPKYLKLKMESASGTVVPANNGGKIIQQITLENTMHGTKKMRVRVRISYTSNGQNITEQTQIDSLE